MFGLRSNLRPRLAWIRVMSIHPKSDDALAPLRESLRRAHVVTLQLMSKVLAQSCERFAAPHWATKASRIRRLVELGAWADAALAIIDLELPYWTLRRMVYEDGQWHCALSKRWQLPDWLDDAAEAHHDLLPLAILAAFVEARQSESARAIPAASSIRRRKPSPKEIAEALC